MKFVWDDVKAAANYVKHGVAFEEVPDFDWELALETLDLRMDYRESRVIAISTIGSRLHVLVYALRSDSVRVISLRKANEREIRSYEKAKNAKRKD